MNRSRCPSSSRQVPGALSCCPSMPPRRPSERARARILCPMPFHTSPALLCPSQVEINVLIYLGILRARTPATPNYTQPGSSRRCAQPHHRTCAGAATSRLPACYLCRTRACATCCGHDCSAERSRPAAPQVWLAASLERKQQSHLPRHVASPSSASARSVAAAFAVAVASAVAVTQATAANSATPLPSQTPPSLSLRPHQRRYRHQPPPPLPPRRAAAATSRRYQPPRHQLPRHQPRAPPATVGVERTS